MAAVAATWGAARQALNRPLTRVLGRALTVLCVLGAACGDFLMHSHVYRASAVEPTTSSLVYDLRGRDLSVPRQLEWARSDLAERRPLTLLLGGRPAATGPSGRNPRNHAERQRKKELECSNATADLARAQMEQGNLFA